MAVSKEEMFRRHRRFAGAPQPQRRAISFASYAKLLRSNPTESELKMGGLLKAACSPLWFRRQWPMFGRIVDFYCRELRLVIEVNGNSHLTGRAKRRDAEAMQIYRTNGVHVFRAQDWQVLHTPEKVHDALISFVAALDRCDRVRHACVGRSVAVPVEEDRDSFRLIQFQMDIGTAL